MSEIELLSGLDGIPNVLKSLTDGEDGEGEVRTGDDIRQDQNGRAAIRRVRGSRPPYIYLVYLILATKLLCII